MTDPHASFIPIFKSSSQVLRAVTKEYADGHRLHEHWHDGAQLIYASSGVMELTCDHGFWVISPRQALWMPARLTHKLKARGRVQLHTVYLRSECSSIPLPSAPQSLVVSPLLRELVLHAEPVLT